MPKTKSAIIRHQKIRDLYIRQVEKGFTREKIHEEIHEEFGVSPTTIPSIITLQEAKAIVEQRKQKKSLNRAVA